MATRQETFYWPYYPGNVSGSAGASWYSVKDIDFSALPEGAENITCASVELRYEFDRGGIDTRSGYEWINDTDGSRYSYNITATNINNFLSARATWFATNKKISFHPGFKSATYSSFSGRMYFSIILQYEIDAEAYVAYSADGQTWNTYQAKVLNGNTWSDVQCFYCEDGNTWTECNNG